MQKWEKECKNVKGQTWPYFVIKISHILVFWDRAKREGEEKRRRSRRPKRYGILWILYGMCRYMFGP